MDIESVRLTLPRAQAEALLAAVADGSKAIMALEMVKATHKLENAIDKLDKVLQRRTATITVDFDRVEAAALDRAAEIGVRLHHPFRLTWDPTSAKSGIDKLRSAIGAVQSRLGIRTRPNHALWSPCAQAMASASSAKPLTYRRLPSSRSTRTHQAVLSLSGRGANLGSASVIA